MRTIGRWSVASLVSVMLGVAKLVVALAFFLAVAVTAAIPFIPTSALAVVVPVSFNLDTPSPVSIGRTGFGFQILGEKDQARDERKGRIDKVGGSLRIRNASKGFLAANGAAFIVFLAGVLFVLDELLAVLRTLIHGSPFVAANATHIHRIGLVVISGELARAAVVSAESAYATAHVAVAGLTFDAWPHVHVGAIVAGLIILVIAEVFRAGTRLDEEQSLTI